MYCPTCHRNGFRNDHFKYFHQDFMDKVVSKKKDKVQNSTDSTAPENPTVNVVTKNDLQELGKSIAASIVEAIK